MAIAQRVPTSYKVAATTKRRVDLIASALGVEKSAVIDQAVELLAHRHRSEIRKFLEEAKESLEDLNQTRAGELFTGKSRPRRYAGGPAAP